MLENKFSVGIKIQEFLAVETIKELFSSCTCCNVSVYLRSHGAPKIICMFKSSARNTWLLVNSRLLYCITFVVNLRLNYEETIHQYRTHSTWAKMICKMQESWASYRMKRKDAMKLLICLLKGNYAIPVCESRIIHRVRKNKIFTLPHLSIKKSRRKWMNCFLPGLGCWSSLDTVINVAW